MARRAVPLVVLGWLVAACGSTVVTPGPASPATSATPGGTPTEAPATAPPPTPVGSSTDVAACRAEDMAVEVAGDGDGGMVQLTIRATNRGTAPCVLDGPPTSIALRAGGGSLPLAYQARADPFPGDQPDLVASPVLLPPGWLAVGRAIWSNWCLGPADVSTVWIGFGTEAMDAHPDPLIPAPACANDQAESTVAGFPFEADNSGG